MSSVDISFQMFSVHLHRQVCCVTYIFHFLHICPSDLQSHTHTHIQTTEELHATQVKTATGNQVYLPHSCFVMMIIFNPVIYLSCYLKIWNVFFCLCSVSHSMIKFQDKAFLPRQYKNILPPVCSASSSPVSLTNHSDFRNTTVSSS